MKVSAVLLWEEWPALLSFEKADHELNLQTSTPELHSLSKLKHRKMFPQNQNTVETTTHGSNLYESRY
jgi:hypothetical protein